MDVDPDRYCALAEYHESGGISALSLGLILFLTIIFPILLILSFISCCYCKSCTKVSCCLSLIKCSQSCIRGLDFHGCITFQKRTVANGVATLLVIIMGTLGILLLLGDYYNSNQPISFLPIVNWNDDSTGRGDLNIFFVMRKIYTEDLLLRQDITNQYFDPSLQIPCKNQIYTFVQFKDVKSPLTETNKFTLLSANQSHSEFSGTMFLAWPILKKKSWPLFRYKETQLDPSHLDSQLNNVFPLFKHEFYWTTILELELAWLEYREGGNHVWLPRSIYSSPSVISSETKSDKGFSFTMSSPNQKAFEVQTNYRSTGDFLIMLVSYIGGLVTILNIMKRLIDFKPFRGFTIRPERLIENQVIEEEEHLFVK